MDPQDNARAAQFVAPGSRIFADAHEAERTAWRVGVAINRFWLAVWAVIWTGGN